MCSLDGWTVELLYQKTKTDSKGHNITTYTNRLTIVVVLDPCVDYPMGYAVGDHECPELIKAALRNAAIHSRELTGEMLRYNQVQSDRYAITRLMGRRCSGFSFASFSMSLPIFCARSSLIISSICARSPASSGKLCRLLFSASLFGCRIGSVVTP